MRPRFFFAIRMQVPAALVLAEPAPPADLPLATAMWHFTRAVSLTSLGRLGDARKEREVFHGATAAVPKDATFGNSPASDILAIAARMLEGEMAAKEDRFDESVNLLREAIKVEDGLRYDEPPDWMQPVRHTLGAVLLRAGRYAEASEVEARFGKIWSKADVTLSVTCYCQQGV
jgi:hypothetical protein